MEHVYFRIIEALMASQNSYNSGDFMEVVNIERANARKWFTRYKNKYNPALIYNQKQGRFLCLAEFNTHLIDKRDAMAIVNVSKILFNKGE